MENCKKLLDMIQEYENILKGLSKIESSMYSIETYVEFLYQSYNDNDSDYKKFKKLFGNFKEIHNKLSEHIMKHWIDNYFFNVH